MKKIGLFIISFVLANVTFSQSSVDSAVIQYLRTVKNIPYPELTITRLRKGEERSANFYISPIGKIIVNSNEFQTFIFGSSASHTRKYLLIKVISGKKVIQKVLDNAEIEDAINDLISFIKAFKLSNSDKSFLIRQLTFTYN